MYQDPNTPKLPQLVIKYSDGLVKDERQANYVLLGLVAISIVVSIIFLSSDGSSYTPQQQELAPPEWISAN